MCNLSGEVLRLINVIIIGGAALNIVALVSWITYSLITGKASWW